MGGICEDCFEGVYSKMKVYKKTGEIYLGEISPEEREIAIQGYNKYKDELKKHLSEK